MADQVSFEEMMAAKPKGNILRVPEKVSLQEMALAKPPEEDPEAGFSAAKAFGGQIAGAVRSSADLALDVVRHGPPIGAWNPGGVEAVGRIAKGAGESIVGAVHSVGEMAVAGIEAIAKWAVPGGMDFRQGFEHGMEQNAAARKETVRAANELVTNITGLRYVPAEREAEAFERVLMLLPQGFRAIGETYYEKTGDAIVASGFEALQALLLFPSKGAAGVMKPVETAIRGGPQGPAGSKVAGKVASAFDELVVNNPEAAAAVAEHVKQSDALLGELLGTRVDSLRDASPEQLKQIGSEAAKRKLLTQEGTIFVDTQGGASRTRPAPRKPTAYVNETGQASMELGKRQVPYEKPVGEKARGWQETFYKEAAEAAEKAVDAVESKKPVVIKSTAPSEPFVLGESFQQSDIGMAGDVGVEITKSDKGYTVHVLREGERTTLETFPTKNLADSFRDELLARQQTKAKLEVILGGKSESRVPEAEGTPGQYPVLQEPNAKLVAAAEKIPGKMQFDKTGGQYVTVRAGSVPSGSDWKLVNKPDASAETYWRPGKKFRTNRKRVLTPEERNKLPLESRKEFDAALVQKNTEVAQQGIASAVEQVGKAAESPEKPAAGMDDPGYVDLNMGIPIRLSDLKAAFNFMRRAPGVDIAEGKLAEYWDAAMRTFAPESRGPEGKLAGAIVASRIAEQKLNDHMRNGPPSQTRRSYWNMHPGQVREFISSMESGKPPADPVLQEATSGYKAWNNSLSAKETQLGIEYEPIDNYLYHVFEDGPGVAKDFQRRSGVKWGQPSFIKERVFASYAEAEKAGFKPKFTNPEDIMLARQHAHNIAVGKVEVLNELASHGLAIPVKKGETVAPQGFAPAPRKSPTGRSFWVHEQADVILNNLYDTRSLWTMGIDKGASFGEKVVGAGFRGSMFLKNSTVPVILAASGFHPLHVLTIDNIPAAVRAIKEWGGEAISGPEAIVKVAKALSFAGIVTHPRAGGRINSIVKGKIPPQEWTTSDKIALQTMMEGGFVPLQPHIYKTGALKNVRDAVEKAIGAAKTGQVAKAGTEAVKALCLDPDKVVL